MKPRENPDSGNRPSEQVMNGLTIDRNSETPPHEQLRAYIQYMISTRAIPPGTRLPSVRALARTLDLSRSTVQRAYEELQRRELVHSQHGAGTFVVDFDEEAAPESHPELEPYIEAAISTTRRLGFSLTELEKSFSAQIRHAQRRASSRISVVYVDEYAYLLRMANFLREELTDLDVDILPIHLGSHGADGLASLVEEVYDADILVCAPYVFGYVRRALQNRPEDVLGITLTLHSDTLERLGNLSPSAVVGVVAPEPAFLSFATAVIRANVVTDQEPVSASPDTKEYAKVLADCDVIVFHAGSREDVLARARDTVEIIELVHVPDPGSIERLRKRLRAKIAHRYQDDVLPS